jgi:hypothetical protein
MAAALLERDANAFFFAPDDLAGSLQLIAPNNQRESVRNIERAQNFERCPGSERCAHCSQLLRRRARSSRPSRYGDAVRYGDGPWSSHRPKFLIIP